MSGKGRISDFTVEQRVLIHLFEHPLNRSQWDGKREQTQAGISLAVKVARKHLPRSLKSLISQDLVKIDTRHIPGSKQRCRIYSLTESGIGAAESIRSGIKNQIINTEDGEISIGKFAGHELAYLDILSKVDSNWNYNPVDTLESSLKDKPETELYRKVLHRAWNDGIITEDERIMLDDISIHLGLEPDIVEEIEKEVISARKTSNEIQKNTFIEVLSIAWQDGYISDDEQAMLDTLANALGLDKNYAKNIQSEWVNENS